MFDSSGGHGSSRRSLLQTGSDFTISPVECVSVHQAFSLFEPADGTEDAAGEEVRVERQVKIYSTRKAKVYETEIIEMTSELIGFGDEEVTYQWQVDRGDGLGWVDVENATRWKYTFIVDRETALYNWRLIVTVVE